MGVVLFTSGPVVNEGEGINSVFLLLFANKKKHYCHYLLRCNFHWPVAVIASNGFSVRNWRRQYFPMCVAETLSCRFVQQVEIRKKKSFNFLQLTHFPISQSLPVLFLGFAFFARGFP
jgi:hypothetical protein